MNEVIRMLKWLKENSDKYDDATLDYFTQLASMYFEVDIKEKMEDK